MTSKIQISGKSNSGVILAVGGDTYEEFIANLGPIVGGAQKAEAIAEAAAALITPSNPAQQPAAQQGGFAEANNVVSGAFGQTQPVTPSGEVPLCPTHKQPVAELRSKATNDPFFKCQVNGTIVSEWKKHPQLKSFCPAPK